jgi:hypothetical protein
MPQRSQLISEVRTACNGLPDAPLDGGGLPSNLIFETLIAIESEMLRDHDLAGTDRRVAKEEIPLNTNEESVPISATDFHAPTHAYLRTDNASELWWPVEIVEHASLTQAAAQGQTAIAIAGGEVFFSWFPDTAQTLRLWYERGAGESPQPGEYTELGSLYDEYLKLMTIAQCREYLKLEVGQVLKARLARSERQWQRYVNRGHQRGQGYKTPIYASRLLRRRGYYADRTRFFLP